MQLPARASDVDATFRGQVRRTAYQDWLCGADFAVGEINVGLTVAIPTFFEIKASSEAIEIKKLFDPL